MITSDKSDVLGKSFRLVFPTRRDANVSSAPSGFYDHNGTLRTNSAAYGQPPHQGGHASYYTHHQQQSYQPMYYHPAPPMNPRGDYMGHQAATFDTRRRGFDELNDFFGHAKRRAVDPTSYAQVGRSLMPLHASLNGPIAAEMMTHPPGIGMGAAVAHGPGPLTQHYYLPPMPNIRTKEDLEQIDQVLEQMSVTVYESTAQQQQNAAHYAHTVESMRHQSPIAYPHRPSDHYAISNAAIPSPLVTSSHGTPAVTPPSSTLSVGHSPSASSSGMSPSSRHSSAAVQYPSLPSGVPYQGQPANPTLGSSFGQVQRRESHGMLQAANPGPNGRGGENEDRTSTPRAADRESISSPSADSSADGSEPESYDDWIQNIRTIEKLRMFIRERLEKHEYEEPSGMDRMDRSRIDPMVLDSDKQRDEGPALKVEQPLYPSLPRVC